MADLQADFDFLATSLKQLQFIQSDLRDLDEWRDELMPAIGAPKLRDAMTDFIDNWDDNRGRLIDSIESVGKLIEETRERFSSMENELTKLNRRRG
ncbi:hypothetical protein AAH978_17450 [Streptomyces sp. ZYX-F-203]